MVVINERGVYKLAFRSNKPNADAFTNWVAGEVLPQIRRTGAYRAKQHQRYLDAGKTEEWIEERVEGIQERKHLTGTLQEHGVEGRGYADCTNAIYRPVLGGTATMVKVALQVPVKANLRDHLSTHDLIKVKFAEAMAAEKIERDQVQGNDRCQKSCQLAGNAVATALTIVRNTRV